ncbi:MAG: cytochrome c [Flavobacteriales bacterium]|nr:cytochrome c [Flavobacteriales bacterium]
MKTSRWPITTTLFVALTTLAACGGGAPANPSATQEGTPDASSGNATAKPGLITAADLTLGDINKDMAAKGETTYDVKCQACHSRGGNRVVGPGWKGLTTRREPAWIMNMIMNVDVMLADDPEAQKLLEECLVRMPNQNLTKDEARELLEFMRTL